MAQPHVANARSVRNSLERASLRQAASLFETNGRQLTVDDLQNIAAPEILANSVFSGGIAAAQVEPSQ